MAKTFVDYVRNGRLQKNFDNAVEKAAEEAKQQGLRRSSQEANGGTDVTKPQFPDKAEAGLKLGAP